MEAKQQYTIYTAITRIVVLQHDITNDELNELEPNIDKGYMYLIPYSENCSVVKYRFTREKDQDIIVIHFMDTDIKAGCFDSQYRCRHLLAKPGFRYIQEP